MGLCRFGAGGLTMAANTHSLDLETSSNQYASITDGSQTGLDITGDFTLEAWIKLETSTGEWGVVGKYDLGSNQRSYLLTIDAATNRPQLYFSHDGTGTLSQGIANYALTDGVWAHIAVAVDVSVPLTAFYIDGSSVANASMTTNSTSVFNSTAPFAIGGYFNSGAIAGAFDGLIDEVRVWDDIRTADEILANLYTDVSGQGNLKGYWKLNNDYTDSSGNGNTLTATGSPVFSTDVPFANYSEANTGVGFLTML